MEAYIVPEKCHSMHWFYTKVILTVSNYLVDFTLDLKENDALRLQAGMEANLINKDQFDLENFTYSNGIIAKTMFRHLENTDFVGITVSV